MDWQDEQRQLERVRVELLEEFSDQVGPAAVDASVREEVSRFQDARVRSFIPVLARRRARERLLGMRVPG